MKTGRDFPLLLAGQFLGAFGDNFILASILSPLTYELGAGRITEQNVNAQNSLYSAVFFFPFILFAPIAGYLNDRMRKTTWLVGGNLIKVLGTALGWAAIREYGSLSPAGHAGQVVGYTVIGLGACAYSPAKYGILPEIVPNAYLVKANGWVEMLTLVAILAGLYGGAALYDHYLSLDACYGASAALYLLALALNAVISPTPHDPSASVRRSASEFWASLKLLAGHPRLGRILLGSGTFWFAGAVLRSNLQGWGLEVFREAGVGNVTNTKLVLLKVGLVVGIVSGTALAGRLHRIGELGWTRRYGWGLAAGILCMGLMGGRFGVAPVVAILVAAGVSAGLMLIPLNAALQAECDQRKLGKTVSIQNFVDYFSMLAGAGFLALLTGFDLSPLRVFVALAAALAGLACLLRIRPASSAGRPGAA
jgi:MFS transporter, LPLT family, lysophospholipid transporter